MAQHGWTNLVAAIRRILAGEREADAFCEKLDSEDAMIVETTLAGLADPPLLRSLRARGAIPRSTESRATRPAQRMTDNFWMRQKRLPPLEFELPVFRRGR